jgi:hypothetical protein
MTNTECTESTRIDFTSPAACVTVDVELPFEKVTRDFQGIGFEPLMLNGSTSVLVQGDEKVILNRLRLR